MTRHRYPPECPVFEMNGEHWEGRPTGFVSDEDANIGVAWGGICLLPIADESAVWLDDPSHMGCAIPLTPAARELLAWARGEL